ncbi:MAG TPA: hypothetical protein VEA58_01515, partial [Anaerovoracaceae bacterium]|nr:hypothetical protein [Anaerovoracaceae bacterium]
MNDSNNRREVIFSKPITCPFKAIPEDFRLIAEESRISFEYGNDAGAHFAHFLDKEIKKLRGDKLCVVIGRLGEQYALHNVLKLKTNKIPMLVLTDVEWHFRYRFESGRIVKKLGNIIYHNLLSRGVARIGVFCKYEIESYSRTYGIPPEKFFWLPYCSNLPNLELSDLSGSGVDPYVFSGGVHDRDYFTLFDAVESTGIPVKIAAPLDHFSGMRVPSNVSLLGK